MRLEQWGHSLFYKTRSPKKKIPELPDSEVQKYQSSGSVFPAFSRLFLHRDKITAAVRSTTSPSQETTEGRKPEGPPTFPLFIIREENLSQKSPDFSSTPLVKVSYYAHPDQSLGGERDCPVWFNQSQLIFKTWGLDCLLVGCLKLTFNWMSYLFIC